MQPHAWLNKEAPSHTVLAATFWAAPPGNKARATKTCRLFAGCWLRAVTAGLHNTYFQPMGGISFLRTEKAVASHNVSLSRPTPPSPSFGLPFLHNRVPVVATFRDPASGG